MEPPYDTPFEPAPFEPPTTFGNTFNLGSDGGRNSSGSAKVNKSFTKPASFTKTEGVNPTPVVAPSSSSFAASQGNGGIFDKTAPSAKEASGDPHPNLNQQAFHNDNSLSGLADMYSKQGKDLYSQCMYEKALEVFTKALRVGPPKWEGRSSNLGNRAATYVMLSRFVEAVDDCDQALRLDPTAIKLHVRKAKSLMRLGHFSPAEEVYQYVLNLRGADLVSYIDAQSKEKLGTSMDEDSAARFRKEQTAVVAEQLEFNKQEALSGMKELALLRQLMKNLVQMEGQQNHLETLGTSDEILKRSPFCKIAHMAKANGLSEMMRFEEAKHFIEETVTTTPESIQRLEKHPSAGSVFPNFTSLTWREIVVTSTAHVATKSVVSAMLYMGSDLAQIYLICLKNQKLNRTCSADIMAKVLAILADLLAKLNSADLVDAWQWVITENEKLEKLMNFKNTADQQFKSKSYRAALLNYANALKTDFSAKKWNAILYCNRAASNMALENHKDALMDCHNAIAKDPDYARAYLRRARAYKSLNKYQDSIRDYRTYLNFTPVPSDSKEVRAELEAFVALQSAPKQPPPQSKQSGPNSNFRSSNGPGGVPGYGERDPFRRERPQSGSARPGGGPSSQYAGSSGSSSSRPNSGRANAGSSSSRFWDEEDDEDDYMPGARGGSYKSTFNSNSYYNSQSKQAPSGGGPSYNSRGGAPGGAGRGGGPAGGGFFGARGQNSSSSSSSNARPPPPAANPKSSDHYTVLGLGEAASERDIKVAYHKMALKFHPDKNKEEVWVRPICFCIYIYIYIYIYICILCASVDRGVG